MRISVMAILFILAAAALSAQTGLWEKRGTTAGFVWDIIRDTHLPGQKTIAATDSGFYASGDLVDWTPVRTGFQDLSIRQLAWVPIDGTTSAYAALASGAVYARSSAWTDWAFANDAGLDDGQGYHYGYRDASSVAFFKVGGTWYLYLALTGVGVFSRSFDPYATGDPWGSQWNKDTSFTGNPYITAMVGVNGGSRLIAASCNNTTPSYQGNLYYTDGSGWVPAGTPGVDYLSLAGDPAPGGSAKVLAGTGAAGVYESDNYGTTFAPLCGVSSTLGPFQDVALWWDGAATQAVATTGVSLYKLNWGDACANPYVPFDYFTGFFSKAVLPIGPSGILVGTGGNGLWFFPASDLPGEPRGHTGSGAMQNANVSDIAIAPPSSRPDAPPVIFTASETDGLYKCFRPTYCTRYFFAPVSNRPGGVSGRSVALVPGYDEFGEVKYNAGNTDTIIGKKTLYLGTADAGLFRSDNGGASWKKVIGLPAPSTGGDYEIVKVLVSPDFDPTTTNTFDKHMFVLTRDGTVYRSTDGGETWLLDGKLLPAQGSTGLLVAEDLAIAAGYNRGVNTSQTLFAATSFGLFKRVWATDHFEWQHLPQPLAPIVSVALSPCFGLPGCPECQGGDSQCPKEMSTIVAGSMNNGIYYSVDGGNTFSSVNHPSCPGVGSSITAVAMHPKTDVAPTGDRLLTYLVKHAYTGAREQDQPKLYYVKWVYSVPNHFECFDADPSDPPIADFADVRVRDITFYPTFGANGNWDVYAGHDYSGMWHAFHPPTTNPPEDPTAWDRLDGFYNTPDRIYSVAECPDPVNADNPNTVVMAGTADYGVMISFDGGESYFPWGLGLEYASSGKRFTLHDAWAVVCSENFDPCGGVPSACPQHRILASTADCVHFDGSAQCDAYAHHGIYYGDFSSPMNPTRWSAATLAGAPMTGHYVPELRYCAMGLPMLAADAQSGPLYSQPDPSDLWGRDWHLDNAGDPPTTLADLTCPGGQPGPTLGMRSLPDPRGGRPGFIWGAQSGVSQGFRAVGMAKFKTSSTGSWQSCTGLSTTANWRSIIMLDSGTVLIGDKGEDANLSSGIFRNAQDGSTCNAWSAANTGFNAGDSSEITQNYSKKVIAFAEVANGVLAAMEEGGLGGRAGGIFFSDTSSDGLAWVPVNSGMSCSSNYDVYNGSAIYTGSTCDGVYATDTITYTGYPTAYFEAAQSSNPWYETRVTFTDRSAGLVTACAWDFGDSGTSGSCNPTHDYDLAGDADQFLSSTVTLTGTNNAAKSDTYSATVEVVDTKITGVTKVSGNTIRVTWAIPGGGKSYSYTLYRDTAATGGGATAVAGCSPSCSTECYCEFTEAGSEAYYKIRTAW